MDKKYRKKCKEDDLITEKEYGEYDDSKIMYIKSFEDEFEYWGDGISLFFTKRFEIMEDLIKWGFKTFPWIEMIIDYDTKEKYMRDGE